ncbi:MAG: lipid A biosynthesis acyltransferase [Thiohalomonadaceae bacterium]
MSKAWFQQRERGSPLMIGIILWVAQHIGRPVARLLLWPITGYFLLTAGHARRASRDYLQRIHGRPARWWQVARHIHCFAATILDRVYFLTGQFQHFEFRYHGLEVLAQMLAQGRGALVVGAHMGSFEVLRALAILQFHTPMKVLMYQDHNQYLTGLFNRLNPEVAASVIPLGRPDALIAVHEALQQGLTVGMLGDRVAESEKQTHCGFLGEETVFPAGPAVLASILQVPVLMILGLYQGGNRYELFVEALPTPPALGRHEREAMIQQWTQQYAERLEYHARQSPYNWFNFYDYWQSKT